MLFVTLPVTLGDRHHHSNFRVRATKGKNMSRFAQVTECWTMQSPNLNRGLANPQPVFLPYQQVAPQRWEDTASLILGLELLWTRTPTPSPLPSFQTSGRKDGGGGEREREIGTHPKKVKFIHNSDGTAATNTPRAILPKRKQICSGWPRGWFSGLWGGSWGDKNRFQLNQRKKFIRKNKGSLGMSKLPITWSIWGLQVLENESGPGFGISIDYCLDFSESSESMAPRKNLGRHWTKTGKTQSRRDMSELGKPTGGLLTALPGWS